MKVLVYNKEDHYDTMKTMWNKRKWDACPDSMLPRIGYVVYDSDNSFIGYMGVYIEYNTMGFIGWAITDPDIDKTKTKYAMKLLFDLLKSHAVKSGCKLIYSITNEESWGNELKSYGMNIVEQNVNVYALMS